MGTEGDQHDIGHLLERGEDRTRYRRPALDWIFVGMDFLEQPVPAAEHVPAAAISLHRFRRIERFDQQAVLAVAARSEENTSELQSLMRTSYAVFCLKKNTNKPRIQKQTLST